MVIDIALRMRPFCHLPGTLCLLPGTSLKVQVFPARVYFFTLENEEPLFYLSLQIKGPVENFTVELDLEQSKIKVFGKAQDGFFRYTLSQDLEGVLMVFEKVPALLLPWRLSSESKERIAAQGKTFILPYLFGKIQPIFCEERLSLGCHKAQDWQLITRRQDLKEIFPFWLRLGQLIPSEARQEEQEIKESKFVLLEACQQAVTQKNQDVLTYFKRLFLAGFGGIGVPRLFDTHYQGIVPEPQTSSLSHCAAWLLSQSAQLLRSLFFQEKESIFHLLPFLPADFHAGRFVGIKTKRGDTIDIEWSKKQIRCVVVTGQKGEMALQLPSFLRCCRIRESLKQKGKEVICRKGRLTLSFDKNQRFFPDRFEK